jgi:uracil-DNA glycosylase
MLEPAPTPHASETLFGSLDSLAPYPAGVVRVPRQVRNMAFFPGGLGVAHEPGEPPPALPVGGIMVLAHNLDSEVGFRRTIKCDGENRKGPTWRRLREFLQAAGIHEQDCFFTNFFMGLCEGAESVGQFPGCGDAAFVQRTLDFFIRQFQTQRPKIVLVLGANVPPYLGQLGGDLSPWSTFNGFAGIDADGHPLLRVTSIASGWLDCPAVFVALTHPSYRHLNAGNRIFGGKQGDDAEVAMVSSACALAGYKRRLA